MARFEDPRDLNRHVGNLIRRIRKIPEEIVTEAGDLGVEKVREVISSKEVQRPTSQGPGRSDNKEGDMYNNVKWWVTSETEDSKRVAVGWQLSDFAGKRTPAYPQFQDEGFMHVGLGEDIPGMHALQDASDEVRAFVVAEIKRKLRDRRNDIN